MKTAGLHLLCLIVAAPLAAQTSAAAPVAQPLDAPSDLSSVASAKAEALAKAGPTQTSLRLKEEIRTSLPPFTPSPKVLDQPHGSGTEIDPDLFALPKYTVKEKRPPSHDPDVWQADRVIQRKAMLAYRDSMTPLEWTLNSWFIPILSAPASARARAAYQGNKIASQVSLMTHVAEIHRLTDAKNPDGLIKAVTDMRQADDWQSRPAGDGRAK